MSLINDSNFINDVTRSSGSAYTVYNTFNDLPSDALTNTIAIVSNSTGLFIINRKRAGVYIKRSNAWERLGIVSDYFNDNNFEIYNNTTNSKKIKFSLANISSNTTRLITIPDRNFTIADADDVSGVTTHFDWIKYILRSNREPTLSKTISNGSVFLYTYNDGGIAYRFIPTTYSYNDDAFYTSFNSSTDVLSGLLARRASNLII